MMMAISVWLSLRGCIVEGAFICTVRLYAGLGRSRCVTNVQCPVSYADHLCPVDRTWRVSWLQVTRPVYVKGIPVPQIASYFMNFKSYPERKPSGPSALDRIFEVRTFKQWIIWVSFINYLKMKARLLLPFCLTSANHIIYLFHPSCFWTVNI